MPPIIRADDIVLQLAEPRTAAFTAEGWAFELKLDGFRLLAERIGGKVRLVLRRGREATAQFPEIAEALAALPGGDFILDGELVIQDEVGRPIFQRLLKRSTLTAPRDISKGMHADPAVYFAFDLLMYEGVDLRGEPLSKRKALLLEKIPKADRVVPLEHVETQGEALLEAVRAKGLEGVMAKRLDAPYTGGRSDTWLKIALKHVADFAVVGWADDWGALYLATWDGARFVYAGKVGSGFTPKLAESLKPELEAHRVRGPPCAGDPPREKEAVWCTPTVVVEVRYKNWPEGLSLREPTFLRVRDDKTPKECPTPTTGFAPAPSKPPPEIKVSNADKVFFPESGITKGEVVGYYRAVSRWLLPYLRDRPLMLTRYPDGITGKSFFQKAKPQGAPDFIRTVSVFNEEEGRALEQIVCDDVRTLEWCATMGAIPLHIPAARVATIDRADWVVIDFDPKDASFDHVIELARALKRLCDEAELPSFPKTSGSSGLHVLIPLGLQLDHAGARQLAELFATLLVQAHPKIATLERTLKKRGGRVYVDAGQNGAGRLIAAPLCVRAQPGAPVSMPLTWDEVKPGLGPRQFTVRDAVGRLEQRGDPMAKVLELKPDLARAVERLGGKLAR
ncbi:MAG: DNA ligase D [Myxococcota bacterium]